MKIPRWLLLAAIVPVLWGVWGALIEIPEKWVVPTFPSTLGYALWSFTKVLVAAFALRNIHWKLESDFRSVVYVSQSLTDECSDWSLSGLVTFVRTDTSGFRKDSLRL
jgi:hypothetical protein